MTVVERDRKRARRAGTRLLPLALLLCLFTPAITAAAEVSGSVRDAETQAPLGFATVQVIGLTTKGGRINRGTLCSDSGEYALVSIPRGRYVLRVSRIGYETAEDSFLVTTDRRYHRDFELRVKPVEIEEIVVEADRFAREKELQTGFISVDAAELAELPGIIEGDPIRSLQLMPGVQAASDISSGLYIRGGGPDQTLVLLDGVPVYNPTHAFGFFSTFNSDALGEINLYKGAYPAEYDGRLGAVLDVHSKDGSRRKVRGRAGVSTIAARVTVEGPAAGGSWMLSGRRTYIEPLLKAMSSEESPMPSYYFYDFNAKLSSAHNSNGHLVLSLYHGRDNVDFDLDEDSEINLVWGNTILSASYGIPINETLRGEVRWSLSRYASDTGARIFTTPIGINNYLQDVTVGGELTWLARSSHRMTAGIERSGYTVSYRQDFNQENQIDYRRQAYEASGFVEDEWTFADGTAVRGGLRFRYLGDGDRYLLEPRFSGVRPLSGEVRLKAGAGLYNQYLQLVSTEGFSAGDFYVPIDDTARPSRSWHSVLGVEWNPVPRYELSAETYYTGLTDLVLLDTNTPPRHTGLTAEDIFYTGGEGYQTGVELFAARNTGALTGWAGYTLGWTRRKFIEINDGKSFPPKYDRRHDLNAVARYRKGKWEFGINFVYTTGQAFTPASIQYQLFDPIRSIVDGQVLAAEYNSSRLLPYHRLDFSVTREFKLFGKPAEFHAQVFNLYSHRNDWFVQYDVEDYTVDPVVVKQLPIIPSIGVNFEF